MSIEVINFKPHKNGCLIGFLDVFVPKMGLEIYGCSVFEKEGRKWVSLPSKEYKNKEGEVKYSHVIRFKESEHHKAFTNLLLEAYKNQSVKEDNKKTHSDLEEIF